MRESDQGQGWVLGDQESGSAGGEGGEVSKGVTVELVTPMETPRGVL